MALDEELFEQALNAIGHPAGYPSELPEHIAQWLGELPTSNELREFLAIHSASSHYEVGLITILPHRRVYSETRNFPFMLDAGFLVIGSSGSGDPLVINLSSEEVGFISHEKLWSFSSTEQLQDDFKFVASTLGQCVHNAQFSDNFPDTYHDV